MAVTQTGYYDQQGVWHEGPPPAAPPPASTPNAGSTGAPQISYTPDGQPKAPGFNNPSNPWDTGYSGNVNAEVARAHGFNPGKMDGWNYDNGTPNPGFNANQYGAGGGGGGGGGAGLASDPYVQQMQALANAQSNADAAARKEAIQSALINFGEVPGNFTDKFGDITDLVRQLAGKGTTSGISTYARLLQQRKDAMTALFNRLSAKGLRRSGARGYGMNRNQLSFDQSYADALNSLLGYTRGIYSNFSTAEYQRQMQILQALQTAAASYYPTGGGGGGGGPSAPSAPSAPSNPYAGYVPTSGYINEYPTEAPPYVGSGRNIPY